jgi:hypothetical protein
MLIWSWIMGITILMIILVIGSIIFVNFMDFSLFLNENYEIECCCWMEYYESFAFNC